MNKIIMNRNYMKLDQSYGGWEHEDLLELIPN